MSLKSEPSTFRKIWLLMLPGERRGAVVLLLLIFLGMLLETLGVGMVVPAIALLTQQNFIENHSALPTLMNLLGSPSQAELVVYGMFVLVGVYLIKAIFLAS